MPPRRNAAHLRLVLDLIEEAKPEGETQLIDANQRRQDTIKRVDELIAQLDQLDAQLASSEPRE